MTHRSSPDRFCQLMAVTQPSSSNNWSRLRLAHSRWHHRDHILEIAPPSIAFLRPESALPLLQLCNIKLIGTHPTRPSHDLISHEQSVREVARSWIRSQNLSRKSEVRAYQDLDRARQNSGRRNTYFSAFSATINSRPLPSRYGCMSVELYKSRTANPHAENMRLNSAIV